MLTHLLLGTDDLEKSHQFYDAFLGALGIAPGVFMEVGGQQRYLWNPDGLRFMVGKPRDGTPTTHYNGFTVGFKADSPEQVLQAVDAALAHGGIVIEDPPGWRSGNGPKRFAAYLRDPSGQRSV